MVIDPFAVKRFSKANPYRLGFTAYAKLVERRARARFDGLRLPDATAPWQAAPDYPATQTAVTPDQMAALIHFARDAVTRLGGAMVEIGSFRGITSVALAQNVPGQFYAVDPFRKYGGAEEDYQEFLRNTAGIANITHIRETSGVAAATWDKGPVSFVFVDAVHDYVNTIFDTTVWGERIAPTGYLAMHDVDELRFAGTRLAAWEQSRKMTLVAHVPGLVILQKP